MLKIFKVAILIILISFVFLKFIKVPKIEANGPPLSLSKKVLVLNFNPVISGTKTLTQYKNWNDPSSLMSSYINDIKNDSHQFLSYQIVENQQINDYPAKASGFKFSNETYLGCLTDHSPSYCLELIDYPKLLADYGVCDKLNSGSIDELWIWGGPYFGYGEAAMAGPGAFDINGPVIFGTSCTKKLPIMGFSYERGVTEMLENMAHRSERTLANVYGDWSVNLNNPWNKFTIYDLVMPGTASCGRIHYPYNATKSYDFSNLNYVFNRCNDWTNYPNTTGYVEYQNCSSWGCTDYGFKNYWLSHLSYKTGLTNNILNNWWTYIADYDAAANWKEDEKDKTYAVDDGVNDFNEGCITTTSQNEIYFGNDSSCTTPYTGKFVFKNIRIPKNTVISDSYLEFVVDGTYTVPLGLKIGIASNGNYTDFVNWDINNDWYSQTKVQTPTISNIVQQMVNSESWQNGNDIVVSVNHNWGASPRRVFALERETLAGARLIIKTNGISTPSPSPSPTPSPSPSPTPTPSPSPSPSPVPTLPPPATLLKYCPSKLITRDYMAQYLLKAKHGSDYNPPAATGTLFSDVAKTYWAAGWIEQLYREGVTAGCGGGKYCPLDSIYRDTMAVFLLRLKYGSSYLPPAATGTLFSDVPKTYYLAGWIEQLYREGVTAGCGGGKYCPTQTVPKDQMAVFMLRIKYGSSYVPPTATGLYFNDFLITYYAAPWIEEVYRVGIIGSCN